MAGINSVFTNVTPEKISLAERWSLFLQNQKFDFSTLKEIDLAKDYPVMTDLAGNKFSIDFAGNKKNYSKKKSGLKTELLSKAIGAGRYGKRILDLSAGLGIDAVFLAQMGYEVCAVERNPLIFLALNEASPALGDLNLKIEFGESESFAASPADVIYFDPMFPEKTKSALPRQEMVFFKDLVGNDKDAFDILRAALKNSFARRVVVKRPIKAEPLGGLESGLKPQSRVTGKLVRFDIYGVKE